MAKKHHKHHGHKHHTGPITHHDMVGLHGSTGHGTKDPHASAAHHAANVAHDMDDGLSPKGGYHSNGHSQKGGAPSEAENCSYE